MIFERKFLKKFKDVFTEHNQLPTATIGRDFKLSDSRSFKMFLELKRVDMDYHFLFGEWHKQDFEGYGFKVIKPLGKEDSHHLYEGFFLNERLNGIGRMISKGCLYEGGFKNEMFEGFGYHKDRQIEAIGEFQKDSLTGHGVLATSEATLAGEFK